MRPVATVFLVGYMGCGKTSVGLELARRLGGAFVDLDRRVEERFGCPIPEIFDRWGEPVFRKAELEELERVAREAPAVVATGGGTYCSAAGRDLIRRSGHLAVYLEVPWEELQARVGGADRDRPLWADPESARQLYEGRLPDYRTADLTVPVTPVDTQATIAEQLAMRLQEVWCGT